jgi:iron complex outermembrane receptor protein
MGIADTTVLRTRLSSLAAHVACALAGCSSAAALAQTDSKGAAGSLLEEVIVTAQFKAERLQETPIAITALSGEMLEARNQTNITEVAANAPSVTLTPAGSGFGNSATASIRGVGQSDFNFAYEPGVGMYIDDVYYGVLFGSVFDLTDLERVEVLRGPQGTLAGKNSVGGAIKLFSRKPSEDGGGYVEATYGSFDRIDLRAGGDFTLISDKLYGRVSGVAKRRDGYMKRLDYNCAIGSSSNNTGRTANDCEIGTEGGQDLLGARVALRWLPTDAIENNLIGDITEDRSEVQATKLLSQGPWAAGNNYVTGPESYTTYATYLGHPGTAAEFSIPPVNTVSAWGVSNNLDIKLTEQLSLKSITAYRYAEGEFSQDIDASPADVEAIYNIVSHRQFTQELRLSGTTASEFLDWTVGAYYYDARSTIGGRKDINFGLAPGGGGIPGILDPLEFLDDDTIDSENKSAFAHLVIHPTDRLSVTGGVRYSEESKDYTFMRLQPNGTPHPLLATLNGLTGSFSGDQVDYRLSVDYRFSGNVMAYTQYSTGFKGGGVNPRPFFATQVAPFESETLDAIEVGLKSDLLDGRLRVNAALFRNDYQDIQLTALSCDQLSPFPGAPCALPLNAGTATTQGAEVEVQLRLGAFMLDASASVLDFEYDRVDTARTGITADMITPFTPERKYSAGMQYEWDIGAGTVTPRVDWSYQSEFFTNALNGQTNLIDGRGLVNARISWANSDDTWEAALSGTNLADKFYYLNNFDLAGPPIFARSGQPGRPREWAVTVKRKF